MENIVAIFAWLNDVLLKMTWLSDGVRWFVENVFGLSVATRLGGSVHFFIYDVFKIFILLSVLIYTLSYIQSYFPPERTRLILGRMTGIKANIMGGIIRYYYAILFMFFDSVVYWFYPCRTSGRRHFFLSDFITTC